MNKTELVDAIANQTNLSKADSARALNATIDSIIEALKGGDGVSLVGFGTFSVRHRPQRDGRNPQTGAPITISARNVPAFKPGKAFKEAV
jgi:nucleoid DNA-binding protein